MAGQLLSDISGYASTQFDTKIPALTDTADIQEAFSLYHYGLDNYDGSIPPAENSIEAHFVSIDERITDIENTPTGGGIVQDEVPHLLIKEGGGTDSVPEGYIWVDGNGSVPSITSAGVVSYINNEPLEPTHGQVWVDKDTDIAPVNISNYLSVADASNTYLPQILGSATDLEVNGLLATSASVTGLIDLSTIKDSIINNSTINTTSIVGGSMQYTVLKSVEENVNVVSSAPSGTINMDLLTAGIWYYTSNATGNWTLNIRGDSSNTLNSILNVGDSISLAFISNQGATPYYPNVIQIDGSSVTPKIQGGVAISSGNANSTDIYFFTIVKTAATPSYLVLEAQTKFV